MSVPFHSRPSVDLACLSIYVKVAKWWLFLPNSIVFITFVNKYSVDKTSPPELLFFCYYPYVFRQCFAIYNHCIYFVEIVSSCFSLTTKFTQCYHSKSLMIPFLSGHPRMSVISEHPKMSVISGYPKMSVISGHPKMSVSFLHFLLRECDSIQTDHSKT